MFRRRKSDPPGEPAPAAETVDEPAGESGGPGAAPVGAGTRANGPWDASEVDTGDDTGDDGRVDLGGLRVRPRQGLELRLQVDEASQQVAAVLLVGAEGALELRAFAAPRSGGLWDDVRRQIAAETARRGGTADEAEGPFGTELRVVMPVRTPEGRSATQPSRVLGIEGPRWLLRATLLGRPAMEPDSEHEIDKALRDVVVVRGSGPMAPGDMLPLEMPSNARPVQRPQS